MRHFVRPWTIAWREGLAASLRVVRRPGPGRHLADAVLTSGLVGACGIPIPSLGYLTGGFVMLKSAFRLAPPGAFTAP